MLAILVLPALVAGLLGLATFRRRVRGAYFAILSQALAAAFAILLIGNQTATGGSTGLNNFRGFFGFNLYDPVNKQMLFFIAAGVLLAMVALARQLMVSRYGELLVACRDAEERVRFLGYDPANVKTVAYVIAAVMAGIAGALFVPIVGIVSPNDVGHRPVDRVPDRGGDRRADHAARAGARRDRGGLGGHDAVGDDSRRAGPTSRASCSCWSSRSCRAAWRRWAASGAGCAHGCADRRRRARPRSTRPTSRLRPERTV